MLQKRISLGAWSRHLAETRSRWLLPRRICYRSSGSKCFRSRCECETWIWSRLWSRAKVDGDPWEGNHCRVANWAARDVASPSSRSPTHIWRRARLVRRNFLEHKEGRVQRRASDRRLNLATHCVLTFLLLRKKNIVFFYC